MQKNELLVFKLALLSRFFLISLIITWRFLFSPYDSSAQLSPSCLSTSSKLDNPSNLIEVNRVLWPRVGTAIEGSIVWDSVYFVRIAECGYEYEQTYAFLPLLPAAISFLSRTIFAPLIPMIGYKAVLALSGYVLNNLAFVMAAIYFYKLSLLVLKDSTASLQASVLFCFNPASVFYSSIYSESLYALFSFCGVFYLFSGSNTMAMLLLGVSGASRSNGAINAAYFCFKALLQAYDAFANKKNIRLALLAIVDGTACSICLFVPFAAFQTYGYYNMCLNSSSDGLRPWCKSKIPNLYGYLQSHYWGVGFLRYFEVKQLPNFLLAFPILTITIASIIYYVRLLRQTRKSLRNTYDLKRNLHGKRDSQEFIHSSNTGGSSLDFEGMKLQLNSFINVKHGYCSILVLPFILHLGFMALMALFVMHVQVATRFLSASPPIYWFASYLMLSHDPTTSRRANYAIWSYCFAYILLGSLLFSNFYPFT